MHSEWENDDANGLPQESISLRCRQAGLRCRPPGCQRLIRRWKATDENIHAVTSYERTSETLVTASLASDGSGLPLPRRLIGASVAGVVVGLGLMWLWAALAPISGAVVAEGSVRTEGERKTVQHLEGGIVKQILVGMAIV